VQGSGAGSQTCWNSGWQSWRLGTGGGERDSCGALGGAHGTGAALEVRRGRGTDDGMQRPGAMQMASRAGGCEQGDDGRAGKDVEVRAGYLVRRNAMHRVSGRFYIGAGARA
jgi:hypothetical protein